MKNLMIVWIGLIVSVSMPGWAGTKYNDCGGSFYDSKADLIRYAAIRFAIGPVQQGQQESVFVEVSNEVYGIGRCESAVGGDVTCKVSSRSTNDSLPEDLSFVRSKGNIIFEKESGFKGQIQCNVYHSALIAESFAWVDRPQAPGDKASFTIQIKQDQVKDIETCWGMLYGLKGGRRVMGVRFNNCSVIPYENNTKLLYFSEIAPSEFVEDADYYIDFFGVLNKGDAEGSSLPGWGLGPFPIH